MESERRENIGIVCAGRRSLLAQDCFSGPLNQRWIDGVDKAVIDAVTVRRFATTGTRAVSGLPRSL